MYNQRTTLTVRTAVFRDHANSDIKIRYLHICLVIGKEYQHIKYLTLRALTFERCCHLAMDTCAEWEPFLLCVVKTGFMGTI